MASLDLVNISNWLFLPVWSKSCPKPANNKANFSKSENRLNYNMLLMKKLVIATTEMAWKKLW